MNRNHTTAIITAAALGILGAAQVQAALITSGTYDEQTFETISVDNEASGNDFTLADFKTTISNAFDNDLGGVIHFDDQAAGTVIDSGGSFDATFGTSGAAILTITKGANNSGGLQEDWIVKEGNSSGTNATNGDPISGNADGSKVFIGSNPWDFRFGTGLTHVAVTFGSRGNDTISATLLFDSGPDETINGISLTGGQETFVGYEAPAGKLITGLQLNTGSFHALDDLAFAMVPEPTTLALLGLGGAVMLAGRRRRR